MKIISKVLIIAVLLILVSCKEANDSKISFQNEFIIKGENFNEVFTLSDSIQLEYSDSVLLNIPTSVLISNNKIIWSEYNPPFYVFNMKGECIKKIGVKGRGPNELMSIRLIVAGSRSDYYIFDSNGMKVLVLDNNYQPRKQFPLKQIGFKKLTVDNSGNIYTLSDDAYMGDATSVIQYDSNGNKISEWKTNSIGSIFQRYLKGGGICHDKNNNIYYSFMGDYRIWRIKDGKAEEISDERPPFFIEIDKDKLKKMSQREVIKYHFNVSRVIGLYYLDPGFILQQVATPGNKYRSSIYYLIIRSLDGKILKVLRNKIPMVSSFKNKIILIENPVNETSNPTVKIYGINYEKVEK